ncbi:hypothetical protein BXZ70DRAFT_904634 [Cristinia sonorae]|uniref:Uncharacterized protein n=1 Tax=Cristinia sonorae TaxID=1940300 RepID=A0A8K0XTK5_9AGAR|nr:hypothetical protein BXZ70DRAFT_904634 [Cristinia sonorae]
MTGVPIFEPPLPLSKKRKKVVACSPEYLDSRVERFGSEIAFSPTGVGFRWTRGVFCQESSGVFWDCVACIGLGYETIKPSRPAAWILVIAKGQHGCRQTNPQRTLLPLSGDPLKYVLPWSAPGLPCSVWIRVVLCFLHPSPFLGAEPLSGNCFSHETRLSQCTLVQVALAIDNDIIINGHGKQRPPPTKPPLSAVSHRKETCWGDRNLAQSCEKGQKRVMVGSLEIHRSPVSQLGNGDQGAGLNGEGLSRSVRGKGNERHGVLTRADEKGNWINILAHSGRKSFNFPLLLEALPADPLLEALWADCGEETRG